MEYILNETPIKTTNGFRVNNVKVDLELPNSISYHEYEISNLNNYESVIKEDFVSNIGLEYKNYKDTRINIHNQIDELIKVSYNFKDDDNLIDNININVDNNLNINMFLNYYSSDNEYHFHNGNININVDENSSLNLTILNSLNESSINMLSAIINANNNSNIKINLIDLKGKTRIYNFKSNTKKNASSYLNNIYIGKNKDLIDLNYNYINSENGSNNNIEVQGLLDDNAVKTFKGIIDFKQNAKKSTSHENENCLLLSDTCISRSLPILLCSEEDVDGTHSVSSGKIDENKLFYLMCRSLNESEAKKLIIRSNFNKIINELPEEIKEEISNKLDEII